MKKFILDLYENHIKLKIFLCAAVAVLYMALTVYGGGNLFQAAAVWAVCLGLVYLPGMLWRRVIKADRLFDGMDFMTNILLGSGFFCASYCVCMRLHTRRLFAAVCAVAAAGGAIVAVKGKEKAKIHAPDALRWLLILLYFGLLLLFTFTIVIKNALPENVGSTLLNSDLLWNVGNAQSFTLRFIPEDIRYSGVQLHYHYLTELFAGRISWLTGMPAYHIVVFYLQPIVLACMVGCLFSFGRVFFGDEKKAVLFCFSMFIFGCFSLYGCFLNGRSVFLNDLAYHMITNINSRATATIYLCAFSAMFVQLLDDGFKPTFFQGGLLVAAFFMLCFAKGPVAAIVAVGAVVTLVWLFVQRKTGYRALIRAAVIGGLFFTVYRLFFSSGANTSMAFNIWGTLSKTVFSSFLDGLWRSGKLTLWYAAQIICMFVHSFLMAPAAAFLYGAGLIKDVKNLFRLSGRRLWTNSMVAGGFAAFYLFNHYALSQVYFAFLALFFMNLLAVDALHLIKGKTAGKRLAVLAGAAVITTAFMYTNYIGSGSRFLARNLGIIEKYPYNAVVTADDQRAMEFLRANSRKNALFATNRIHADKYKEDGISNIYSALSGRQGYMEGYAYALTNMGVPYYVIDQRKAVNRALFSEKTTADEVKRLRQTAGITHLIFSRQFDGSEAVISTVFEKIYDGDNVRIYSTGMQPLENHPLYQPQLAEYAEVEN